MSASTGTIHGTAQGSIIRPLLVAVAAVVASLAIALGALGLGSAKPTVAPAAPAALVEVGQTELSSSQRAKFPGEAVQPTSLGTGATKAADDRVISRQHGPRVQ